jgi:disulfide bond formation protein DsbB
MRLPMSRLGKVALVLLVLTLVVVGLPIGMPMAPCPQCVLPDGAMCLLVALLTVAAVLAPDRTGGRVGVPPLRLQARLWARRVDRPPQRLPQLV